jgi:hypothetical protein
MGLHAARNLSFSSALILSLICFELQNEKRRYLLKPNKQNKPFHFQHDRYLTGFIQGEGFLSTVKIGYNNHG